MNEGVQDQNAFLNITKKPTFALLKKWIPLHDGIGANFCVTATYETRDHREIIETQPMYLQTE